MVEKERVRGNEKKNILTVTAYRRGVKCSKCYRCIPVGLALLVKIPIDHGQELRRVSSTEASLRAQGLVMPKEQSSLYHLEVLGGHTVENELE
jgi:hypothetical protein